MASRIGMDAGAVRGLADQLDQMTAALNALLGNVNGSVTRMGSTWLGSDAEQLARLWQHQHRPAIGALAEHVHALATTARANANDQDTASGVAGGMSESGSAPLTSRFLGEFAQGYTALRHGVGAGQHHSASATVTAQRDGDARLGYVPVSGHAEATAWAAASESTHAGLSVKGAEVSAAVSAGVGVGVAANGMIGTRYVNATGRADAGAEARADADGKVSLGRDGLTATAKGDAFIGAHADASAHTELGGVGAGAGVHGYAGVGVHADADASVTLHEVKASVTLGAAVGLGGGFSVSVDVQPDKVIDDIRHVHLHW